MRGHIPLPDKASGEVYNSLRTIQGQIANQDIPLIREEKNLGHIIEGNAAYYHDGSNLYIYTRCNGELYRTQFEKAV